MDHEEEELGTKMNLCRCRLAGMRRKVIESNHFRDREAVWWSAWYSVAPALSRGSHFEQSRFNSEYHGTPCLVKGNANCLEF